MKITEIIAESNLQSLTKPTDSSITPVTKVNQLVEIIRTNCSEMVSAYQQTNTVFWRGVDGASGNAGMAFISKIRQDRKPIEMDPEAHNLINRAYKKLNIDAHRGNSIFCTVMLDTAKSWGAPCVVFVKDGWTGSFVPTLSDSYAFSYYRDTAMYALGTSKHNRDIAFDAAAEFIRTIRRDDYLPVEFKGASGAIRVLKQHSNDLLITGDSYIAIKNSTVLELVLQKLGIQADLE